MPNLSGQLAVDLPVAMAAPAKSAASTSRGHRKIFTQKRSQFCSMRARPESQMRSTLSKRSRVHAAQVCHSPFQSVHQTQLAPAARPDEGVSCESCHGAAEPWLRGHTRLDWSYAMRVTAGMRDLKSLYVRANTCVACHQNIDKDLLKAGHRRLCLSSTANPSTNRNIGATMTPGAVPAPG